MKGAKRRAKLVGEDQTTEFEGDSVAWGAALVALPEVEIPEIRSVADGMLMEEGKPSGTVLDSAERGNDTVDVMVNK